MNYFEYLLIYALCMKIANIYDIISLYTHLVLLDTVYKGISGNILFPIGLMSTLVIEQTIKQMTTNSSIHAFKRPDGAVDCDLYNEGGVVDHKSGFPSGHMASTAFYLTFMFLLHCKQRDRYFTKYMKYHIISFLMGVARYQKKCHNIIQICCGYFLGVIMAHVFYQVNILITAKKKNE